MSATTRGGGLLRPPPDRRTERANKLLSNLNFSFPRRRLVCVSVDRRDVGFDDAGIIQYDRIMKMRRLKELEDWAAFADLRAEGDTAADRAAELRSENGPILKAESKTEKRPILKDLGGMEGLIEELRRKVLLPFHHPKMLRRAGATPATGILLKGPPGCGKTTLARAIANEIGAEIHEISATELVNSYYGQSESNIRDLFFRAIAAAPSVLFIDEIDSIAAKRGSNFNSNFMDRVTTQLMSSMDEVHKLAKMPNGSKNGYVLVIGATNRPDVIDPALRRPGRFDREFYLGVPDESSRAHILSRLLLNVRVDGDFDVGEIAKSTPGFVGADLESLIDEAANLAIVRIVDKRKIEDRREDYWKQPSTKEEVESVVTTADIEEAAKIVTPSTKREGFSEIPNVKWDDVGGLHSLRQEFELHIVRRIKFPQDYETFKLPSPDDRGMILKSLARKKPIDAEVDLMALGRDSRCHNFSGADLSALMNEAAMAALVDKQSLSDASCGMSCTIKDVHFAIALTKVSPSVLDKQIQHYNSLNRNITSEG